MEVLLLLSYIFVIHNVVNYYIIHMANPRITWNDIVTGLKPMLCIETWSFGMRHDVWLTELSGLRPTGWEERDRGSERVSEALAAGISHIWGSLDSPITGWPETAWSFRGSYYDSSH